MYDYHMHSDFSADCSTPMEKTVEAAIEKGLAEICFTEHVDYDYPDPTIRFEPDLPSYNEKIQQMAEVYADRIRVKKGLELGLQPHLIEKYNDLMASETCDFVIFSMHATDRKDLHSGEFFNGKTVDEAFAMYYEELLYCVKNFDDYNVLGHVDLVKRYTKEKATNDFHEIISEIFKEIIPKGRGIELNTSGFRYGLESGMPSADILKLYKDLGGEIMTLGSDSHVESTVAYRFPESLELLESLGFRYIASFEKQKPVFHPLEKCKSKK